MNLYLFWSVGDLKVLMIIVGLLAFWIVRTRVQHESTSYSSKEIVETVISLGGASEHMNKQELDKWVS